MEVDRHTYDCNPIWMTLQSIKSSYEYAILIARSQVCIRYKVTNHPMPKWLSILLEFIKYSISQITKIFAIGCFGVTLGLSM